VTLLGFHPPLVRQGIFKGVNLAALTKRFWALESMRAVGRCPEVRWHPRREWSSSGRAHVADRIITVSLGEFAAIEEAVELVLHEAVHCSCPPREMHGELFCRRLIACAREAFGLDLSTPHMLALPAQRGRIAYAIDEGIIAAMVSAGVAAKLRADPETRFEPAPPETEFDTIARQAALEAERENVDHGLEGFRGRETIMTSDVVKAVQSQLDIAIDNLARARLSVGQSAYAKDGERVGGHLAGYEAEVDRWRKALVSAGR
jgi:hypothetical protein